jgi:outer membrane lipoprotein-sorting protein
LKKFFLLAGILFLFTAGRVQAQEDPARYLDAIEKKYAPLKDYQADVNVHFDIEVLQAPDMQARLYYKAPDKMIVEAKKVFFFPKEGGYFNPSLFRKDSSDVKLLEHLTYEGKKAVRLKLIPKESSHTIRNLVLTLDTDRILIRQIEMTSSEGREVKVSIDYGTFENIDLPTRITLHLDIPPTEPSGMREFTQFGQKGKDITGKIEIRYSNYKVNRGLSDDLFKKNTQNQPK